MPPGGCWPEDSERQGLEVLCGGGARRPVIRAPPRRPSLSAASAASACGRRRARHRCALPMGAPSSKFAMKRGYRKETPRCAARPIIPRAARAPWRFHHSQPLGSRYRETAGDARLRSARHHQPRANLARPCGTITPRSSRIARNWFIKDVRSPTARSRVRCRVCMSNCSSLFSATKRMVGRVCRLSDRFGISVIVLLCLDVGPYILRRHQPNRVSQGRKNPGQDDGHHSRPPLQ